LALVIATCWPGLIEEDRRPANRLISEVAPSAVERRTVSSLPGLDPMERAEIAATLVDGLGDRDARMLAMHFTNPLALSLAVRLPRTVRAITAGDLAGVLPSMPQDVEGIYRVMWEELPTSLRNALALAVISSPDGVALRSRAPLMTGGAWDPRSIAMAAEVTPWLRDDLDRLHERLSDTLVAYGWLGRHHGG
jgi:hypothetical protein